VRIPRSLRDFMGSERYPVEPCRSYCSNLQEISGRAIPSLKCWQAPTKCNARYMRRNAISRFLPAGIRRWVSFGAGRDSTGVQVWRGAVGSGPHASGASEAVPLSRREVDVEKRLGPSAVS